MIGQSISHYRIVEKLGEGGMGIVYKGEDTKLDRTVALKFLAPHLLNDDEAKQRFLREAKAAATLNHANICHVYEIDDADGRTFISMAFIEGKTLEERIAKGPLPIKEALDIGQQIAKGLQAAHDKNIVHRDIKPANVLVAQDGQVTIMDFGLARLTEASRLTKGDQTMGTVAYMSPEQVQGMEVDHRSDIWALGVVLYEMITGLRPFQGQYDQALSYEIVHQEPEPLTGVRAGVPMELEFLVGKCLAKDAGSRYRHADELAGDLKNLQEKLKSGRSTTLKTSVGASTADPSAETATAAWTHHAAPVAQPAMSPNPIWKRGLPWPVAAILALALAAVSFFHFREAPVETPLRRFAFTPESLFEITGWRAAISPNGRQVVYVSGGEESKLWIRDLDREEPRELAGSNGAQRPFWSHDSQFIGFEASGELRKIASLGGPAITVCPLPGGDLKGGGWSPEGDSIIFGSGGPARIYEVSARGGEPRLLLGGEEGATQGVTTPSFLSLQAAARGVLFDIGTPNEREIVVQNLQTGEREVLGEGAYPVYSPSGHILYQSNRYRGGLWALPFSLEILKPLGEAFPVAEGAGEPSLAVDGTLVYVDFAGGLRELVWRDRTGEKLGAIGQPQGDIRNVACSPDGRRVAVRGFEEGSTDIWIHEVDRPLKRRLTFHSAVEGNPIWSPSGGEITFRSRRRPGNDDIYRLLADGTGEEELLVATDLPERPCDWSSDGKYLLYEVEDPENGTDLWYLERNEDGSGFASVPFLQTAFDEFDPQFSPQGRFVAYVSNRSGQNQVEVRGFPEGGQWQVSSQGGARPRWSRDGKQLFYVDVVTLIAVEVSTAPVFTPGATTRLFQNLALAITQNRSYDVSADGQRFVLSETLESDEGKTHSIHVVQNWYEEFRDREQD